MLAERLKSFTSANLQRIFMLLLERVDTIDDILPERENLICQVPNVAALKQWD